jgi:hypothetical protein
MKTKTIFKRKVNLSLLFSAVILTSIVGCKKGTFDINKVSPNTPSSVPAKYSLSAALTATASYVQGGNSDVLNNWMGYWTQSGGYTPSTTYVLYQLTSSNYTGNFDNAYLNMSNYALIIKTAGSDVNQANYKAIAMIMESFIYQRLVDLYNKVPYSAALSVNAQFSYKYDDGQAIYNSISAKIDSAVALINAGASNSNIVYPYNYDVMFGRGYTTSAQGKVEMANWVRFAKTLKLKLLMRQTQNGLGSAAVKTALSGYTEGDFLTSDAIVNPGYSNAADNQLNPFYADVIASSTNGDGALTGYWRANDYGVKFYQNNNDPRLGYFYVPVAGKDEAEKTARGYATPELDPTKFKGRQYGSNAGNESNSVISAILGVGFTSAGGQKGPTAGAVILPLTESLFLVAEAQLRGYIAGSATATYAKAVQASFDYLGAGSSTAYIGQANNLTNFANSPDQLTTLITQKWAAMNSLDPLESYSDWRRLGIPKNLPVSIYPGNTATHIPYRLPYPVSETSYNSANVPAGGTGADALTSKIFWMP